MCDFFPEPSVECSWSGDICGYSSLPQVEPQWYKPFRPVKAPGVPISDAEKGITGDVHIYAYSYRLRAFI